MPNPDDKCGYRQPPKSGQFKPGQSGNPAGRPRKKKVEASEPDVPGLTAIDQAILQESRRKVRAREGDHLFELPQEQAVIRSLIKKAIEGSPMALRTIIYETHRAQALELQHRKQIWDSWQMYVASCREAQACAVARGGDGPKSLPHPDDIEFGDDLTVWVRGPSNAEELAPHLVVVAYREFFLTLSVYASRYYRPERDSLQSVDFWMLYSYLLNATLPKSLRVADDQLMNRAFELHSLRPAKLAEQIKALCEKLRWPFKQTLKLARHLQTVEIEKLGMTLVRGSFRPEPRWSVGKVVERIWADTPVEHLTTQTLDMIEAAGLAGPPSWMTRARASIASRESRDEAARD